MEGRITLLVRELSHRLKNQYIVVLAMLRETHRSTGNNTDFVNAAEGRIIALSHAHDLLLRDAWKGANIDEVLNAQIHYFGSGDRIKCSGPPVRLSEHAAQYLALAFHELATNAAKHGGLSLPNGKVIVTWTVGVNSRVFKLQWRETGGRARYDFKCHKGFGHKLLTKLAPEALQATASLVIRDTDVTWTLEAPAACVESPDYWEVPQGKYTQALRED